MFKITVKHNLVPLRGKGTFPLQMILELPGALILIHDQGGMARGWGWYVLSAR